MMSRISSIQSARFLSSAPSKILPSLPMSADTRLARQRCLIQAKEKTGLTFTEIAKRCGITNAYCAQIFHGRGRADHQTALNLKKVIPTLTDEDVDGLIRAPMRTFDPDQFQDPTVYRLYETVSQYGESIKALINEEFGDGIMSAIGLYVQVEKVKGAKGEDRVMITFNGKFLPHIVQNTDVLEKMKKN